MQSKLIALFLFVIAPLSQAELQLASPFQDHMVLQREVPVPVWGKAKAGAEVSVSFSGQTKDMKADAQGKWRVALPALKGDSEGKDFTVRSAGETITLKDVVVGEVWICSGQSNMQFGRANVEALQGLSEDGIRTLEVKRSVAFEEQDHFEGDWKAGAPSSAVAFGFAHHLRKQTDFPVGIILSCWGSTSIEAWMPRDLGEELPYLKDVLAGEEANQEGRAQIKAAIEAGKWSGKDDVFLRRHSTIVYNAMMAPLVPYACRGVVWYQGERTAATSLGCRTDHGTTA